MLIKNIVARVNERLAGEQLTFNDLVQYLDNTIVDINTQLNAKYPLFSELEQGVADYNMFPDRFIIQTVIPGAAWYFYVADEEGAPAAQQYQLDYRQGLFLILRDLIYAVPEQYQADYEQGSVHVGYEADTGSPGITTLQVGEW
jgi:hypothetical protein